MSRTLWELTVDREFLNKLEEMIYFHIQNNSVSSALGTELTELWDMYYGLENSMEDLV